MSGAEQPAAKTCSKCGETKPRDAFHARRASKDGRHPHCKDCVREYGKANADRKRDSLREWRARNKTRFQEQQREYRQANADRYAEHQRNYYAANPGLHRERNMARYWADPDSRRQYARDYGREHAADRAEYARSRRTDPETRAYVLALKAATEAKRRTLKREGVHEPYSRTEIFARYAHACAYCDAPAEHLDHVVPISKGGPDVASNLLPACETCNLSKGAKSLAEWAAGFGA